MDNIMEFIRGQAANPGLNIPARLWSPGGRLYFIAKPAIDDDNTDSTAVIKADWGDEVITDVTVKGIAYKRYACHIPGSATNSILSGGADSADYLGEFVWAPNVGDAITFPKSPKIDVRVWFDLKRGA